MIWVRQLTSIPKMIIKKRRFNFSVVVAIFPYHILKWIHRRNCFITHTERRNKQWIKTVRYIDGNKLVYMLFSVHDIEWHLNKSISTKKKLESKIGPLAQLDDYLSPYNSQKYKQNWCDSLRSAKTDGHPLPLTNIVLW